MTSLPPSDPHAEAIVLLARSAMAAAPSQDMVTITERLAATMGSSLVLFAFLEQGPPSLREVVHRLRDEGFRTIVIVPLLLPMEPTIVSVLERTIGRWRAEWPGSWPAIHVGSLGPSGTSIMAAMLTEVVAAARASSPVQATEQTPAGSIVYAVTRQVMVCGGAPCQAAGSAAVWTHLRNELERLNVTVPNNGVRSARATCLGPCSLAPVVQVFPGPIYYGGVDDAGIDRIIAEHIVGGRVVDDLVYHPSAEKQRIRPRAPEAGT